MALGRGTEREIGPGTLLGRYRLVGSAGSGGMARVFIARLEGAHGFEKLVAIKVIHPHLANSKHLLSMFLDESRVASLIQHTNVCSVNDFGVEDGVPYLVMELLKGAALSEVLGFGGPKLRPLSHALSARIVADAARGLHAAHELRGEDGTLLSVVHRDVSPHNVFVLDEGAIKVLDFGIARMKGRLAETRATELKGKLGYMAPEQITGRDVDLRVDVWALGVTLWEATCGKRLFTSKSLDEGVRNVTLGEIPRPGSLDPAFPRTLERIILGALERDRERRTPTAAALADALEGYLYETGKPFGAAQVACHMRDLFEGDSLEERPTQVVPPAAKARDRSSPVLTGVGFDATASVVEPSGIENEPTVETLVRPGSALRAATPGGGEATDSDIDATSSTIALPPRPNRSSLEADEAGEGTVDESWGVETIARPPPLRRAQRVADTDWMDVTIEAGTGEKSESQGPSDGEPGERELEARRRFTWFAVIVGVVIVSVAFASTLFYLGVGRPGREPPIVTRAEAGADLRAPIAVPSDAAARESDAGSELEDQQPAALVLDVVELTSTRDGGEAGTGTPLDATR